MSDKEKIIFALMQINNLSLLIDGNQYEKMLSSHLISVQVELERQLTNLIASSKLKTV